MKIKGSVRNSKTGLPVKGAKVELGIEDFENYVVLSDEMGEFEYQTEGMHRMVNISVEKEGYDPKNVSYQIDKPEMQLTVVLDELIESQPPKVVIIEPPEPPKKRWTITEFLSINANKVMNFLMDKIAEYRKRRGEDREVEALKKKLELYKDKSILLTKEKVDSEKVISKLEEKLGTTYISESEYVNWNFDKIKPLKSAFKIEVWVEEAGTGKRDILRIPRQTSSKNYHIGDKINICFKSEKDCYLNLWNFGTSGKLTVLFPNMLFEDNFVKKNKTYSIPGEDYPFDYILSGPPGKERVKAIAATQKFNLIELTHKGGEIFTVSRSASRDITVAAKKIETKIETKEWKEWAEAMTEISVE